MSAQRPAALPTAACFESLPLAEASPAWWWAGRTAWRSILLAVLAIGLTGIWAVVWLSRAAVSDAHGLLARHQAQEVETLARLMASKMELLHKELRLAGAAIPIATMETPGTLEALQARLTAGLGFFDHVLIVRQDGAPRWHVRAGQVQTVADLSISDRRIIERSLRQDKPQVFTEALGSTAPLRVYFTVPLRSVAGKRLGVLVGGLPLHSPSLLPPVIVPPAVQGSRLVVWTHEGTILAHSNPSRILGQVRDEPGLNQVHERWRSQTREYQERVEMVSNPDYVLAMATMPFPQWSVARIQEVNRLREASQRTAMPEALSLAWSGVVLAMLCAVLGGLWLARPQALVLALIRNLQTRPGLAPRTWPEWPGAAGEYVAALRLLSEKATHAEQVRQRLDEALQGWMRHSAEGVFLTRVDVIEGVGHQACKMLGYTEQELRGQPIRTLFAQEEDWVRAGAWVRAEFAAHGLCAGPMTLVRKDGLPLPVRLHGHPLDTHGPLGAKLWLMEDTTAEREAEAQHAWEATHDGLTQLFNRDTFVQRLQRLIEQYASLEPPAGVRDGSAGILLYLDVDHFAQINESAGHLIGDDVLRRVARLLETEVNHLGWAAHLGGDEFGVVLPDCPAKRGLAVAEQLRNVIESWQPIYPAKAAFHLTVSIGLVVLERSVWCPDAHALLRAADMACYDAKRAGRNRVVVGRWQEGLPSLAAATAPRP